jgi:hypothetical protein
VHVLAFDGDELVAVVAAVRRRVPVGGRLAWVWYGCDLKVHPAHRGRHIPMQMMKAAFWRSLGMYLRTPRGYAVSMNPGDGAENRVVRMKDHHVLKSSRAATLQIFSCDADAITRLRPVVERHRGPMSYLSLARVKDIVLGSTGKPMPLLHVQFGPCAEAGLPDPQPDHTHMFCAPAGDPLAEETIALGIEPAATASVVSHRMKGCDWRFVLTSDV